MTGTPEEKTAADEAIAHIKSAISSIDDLLTPAEKEELRSDLAEMAALRRRACAAAANIPMA